MDVLFKQSTVVSQHLGRLFVQRVFRIGLQEQILQAVHDAVDGENRLPVFAQNVKTYVALLINVGMVHLRFAFHFGGLVRVIGTYLEAEYETTGPVEALQI